MSKGAKYIQQNNSLTEARYEMTSLEKNVIYQAMSILQAGMETKGGKLIQVSLPAIEDATGSPIDRSRVRKSMKSLLNREIILSEWNGRFDSFNAIASYKFRKGTGMVELELSEEMLLFLIGLSTEFTSFNAESAFSLSGKHAKRLYEMLCQFRSTGKLIMTVLELKERLCLFDRGIGKERYTDFNRFWVQVLAPALKEINEKTEIKVECKLIKEGKKYTKLFFKFHEKDKKKPLPANSEAPAKEAAKPAQWTDGQKKCFAGLTEIHGWLVDKEKLAKKLVINVPSEKLGHAIGRYKELCEGGTPSPPGEYFAALLEKEPAKAAEETPKKPKWTSDQCGVYATLVDELRYLRGVEALAKKIVINVPVPRIWAEIRTVKSLIVNGNSPGDVKKRFSSLLDAPQFPEGDASNPAQVLNLEALAQSKKIR